MKFKLENPQHQITAIRSVVEVFREKFLFLLLSLTYFWTTNS